MIQKIAVIGNGGGGKTTLSRRLAEHHKIPVTHVDSIQFVPGMQIREHRETIQILEDVQAGSAWLIDGYGPLDIIEKRFNQAERIVFVDFPLWRHYWWCTKRQFRTMLGIKRRELPNGCDEASLSHTIKLFKTLWRVHTKMRPELLKMFSREALKPKMIFVRNLSEWHRLFQNGVS